MNSGQSVAESLVVPASRVRVSAEAVRVGPARPTDVPEPKVQVVHEGDAIKVIQITCTCDERIFIRCDY